MSSNKYRPPNDFERAIAAANGIKPQEESAFSIVDPSPTEPNQNAVEITLERLTALRSRMERWTISDGITTVMGGTQAEWLAVIDCCIRSQQQVPKSVAKRIAAQKGEPYPFSAQCSATEARDAEPVGP